MRAYRSGPPTWALALLAGVMFGVGMGTFTKLDGSSWWAAGIGAVVTGVPFGLLMGRWASKWQREVREAEGDLPADEIALAHRATSSGPVPDDPQVRAAALRLANHQLAQFAGRTRKLKIAVMALLFGGSVVGALNGSLWEWLPATAFGTMLISQWYLPRQLRRRIEMLSTASAPDTE